MDALDGQAGGVATATIPPRTLSRRALDNATTGTQMTEAFALPFSGSRRPTFSLFPWRTAS